MNEFRKPLDKSKKSVYRRTCEGLALSHKKAILMYMSGSEIKTLYLDVALSNIGVSALIRRKADSKKL